jgi:hypothetical protein
VRRTVVELCFTHPTLMREFAERMCPEPVEGLFPSHLDTLSAYVTTSVITERSANR